MPTLIERAESGAEPIADLVAAFYGPDGPLVAAGWEVREQQRAMSMDIARAHDQRDPNRHDDVAWVNHEAPCGTGKGLAYLVPGLLIAARARAAWRDADPETRPSTPPQMVVSTANIALQEQLIGKDVPAIADMLGMDVSAVLLKGRNNYVCRREMMVADGALISDPDFARIRRGLEAGWDGDREALEWDPGDIWHKVSRTSDQCTGPACPHYPHTADDPCYWREAIRGWKHAHVVVLNHHMLAVMGGLSACLLAVDEMHELESCVRSVVSQGLTAGTGEALARRVSSYLGEDDAEALVRGPVLDITDALADEWHRVNPARRRYPDPAVLAPGWSRGRLDGAVERIEQAAVRIRGMAVSAGCYEVSATRLSPPSVVQVGEEAAKRAGSLANLFHALHGLHLRAWSFAAGEAHSMWPGSEEPWALYVSGWFSRDGTPHTTSHAAPSDVSWAIRALQRQYPVAAMTSATVPEHRSLRLTFGMPPQGEPSDDQTHPWLVESRLGSPYPLREMGVTVVPRGPSPKDHSWRAWAANAVVEAVRQSEGRALILASSNAQMLAYGEALRERLSYPVKVQREEGRAALREWFKNTVEGVLVATRSFFQGLDVQGDSLSLVVIDRIPFARPGDPVEDAVQRLLIHRNGGGSGYMLRSVPDAAQVLAQGSGRLIRSLSDRGALVVLDNRITKGSPGWRMLRAALPDFPLSFNLDDVGNVLAGRPLVGTPGPPTTRSSSVRF